MSSDSRDDLDALTTSVTHTQTSINSSGSSIGPYRLLERLGEGGMGEVWLAEQQRPMRRQVALKIVKAGLDTAQVIARFEAERQALALMDHQAIAKVFDAGATEQGRPYFAMEFVRGDTLTGYCDRQRLSIRERLELFVQVCEGVQHAHQKGVIHRDLKPSNILVTVQDDRPVPKIIDFGVAKAASQPLTERTLYTSLGGFIGTPEYMSPEQAEMGGAAVDTRTDVYALGVVLYQLLTGVLPFERSTFASSGFDEIRRAIREVDPPTPSSRVRRTAAETRDAADRRRTDPARLAALLQCDLDWITAKALEKDRARRYGSASDLAADLGRYLSDQPVLASPPSTAYLMRKFVRRNRIAVASASTFVVLLIVFGAAMFLLARRVVLERDRANRESATATRVSTFLEGLFAVSDPSEARGNTLTAREILDAGAARVDRELATEPDVQSRLMITMGRVYQGLGLYNDAAPLLERAVATSRTALGADDPQTLRAIHELANLYWYQERLPEAEALYLEIIERRRRSIGRDHPDTLRAGYDLGSLYNLQRRWETGEPLIRETLAAQERVLGEDHVDTLRSMSELATNLHGQGRTNEALILETRATEIRTKTLGEDHIDTIFGSHNLANMQSLLGQHDVAEKTFTKVIESKTRVFGPAHPTTIVSIRRLADVHLRRKQYEQSEKLLLGAYETLRQAKASDSRTVSQTVEQLVALYDAWGKPAEAAKWRTAAKR